jgi:hypothetical protein
MVGTPNMVQKGGKVLTFTQIPHPMHISSEINENLDPGVTSMQ